MEAVSASYLRSNLREILEKVKNGISIQIIQKGVVVAKIQPEIQDNAWLEKEIQLIRQNCTITGDIVSPVFDGDVSMDLKNLLN